MKQNDHIRSQSIEPTLRFCVPNYTVAAANALTSKTASEVIYVTNEVGGATLAFFDGTNWLRVQDRAVIST